MNEMRKTDNYGRWLDGLRDIHARAHDNHLACRWRQAHSGERSPDFDTILKVMTALGLKLHAEAAHH